MEGYCVNLFYDILLVINWCPVGGHGYLKTQENNDSIGAFLDTYLQSQNISVHLLQSVHLCPMCSKPWTMCFEECH